MAQYDINGVLHQNASEETLPYPPNYESTRNNNHQPTKLQQTDKSPLNLRFIRSPQISNLYLKDEFLQERSPHPNSSLITQFLKLFHWSLLVPDVIEYNHERGGFVYRKGTRVWKGLSYIWLFLIVIYLSLICFNDVNDRYTVKAIVGKITWICYTLFDVTVIKCLRMNGDKIARLLTEGNKILYLCDRIAYQNSERPLQKKKTYCIKYVISALCLLSVVFTILFVLYVITVLTATTTNLYSIFMDITSSSDDNTGKIDWGKAQNVRENLLERYTSSALACAILTLWLLLAFGVEIIWVIFLIMTACCGCYFKRILSSCTQIIETSQIETCEGIRIFTKITLILEDFNKLFGTTLLWIVIASVMYAASTLGEFLAGFAGDPIYDYLNAIGMLPFIATLYTGSELHRTGQILPSLIKRQYLHQNVSDQRHMFQLIQGTSIVQYDALSNNVGLKGHGFFTISYIFLTSLVGVIITYSLVAVQLKLGEIPISGI